MATPLLTTKLFVPPVRPDLVSRPRLIERLNAGLHCKLTLISALQTVHADLGEGAGKRWCRNSVTGGCEVEDKGSQSSHC